MSTGTICPPQPIQPILLGSSKDSSLEKGLSGVSPELLPKGIGRGYCHWCPDQVLRVLAEVITTRMANRSQQGTPTHLLKPWEKPQQRPLLATACDCQLKVDLGRQLRFPDTITVITLRPHVVLVSETTRQGVMLELTFH